MEKEIREFILSIGVDVGFASKKKSSHTEEIYDSYDVGLL